MIEWPQGITSLRLCLNSSNFIHPKFLVNISAGLDALLMKNNSMWPFLIQSCITCHQISMGLLCCSAMALDAMNMDPWLSLQIEMGPSLYPSSPRSWHIQNACLPQSNKDMYSASVDEWATIGYWQEHQEKVHLASLRNQLVWDLWLLGSDAQFALVKAMMPWSWLPLKCNIASGVPNR